MFARCVLAVCCAAVVGTPARADDTRTKPAEKAPKKPSVIPIEKELDLDRVAQSVRVRFPVGTVIVPLPDEHALLVYVTDDDAKVIRAMVSVPCETIPEVAPAPRPVVKTFAMHFKNAKWSDVLDWYAKESGLTLVTTVKPTGTFTFTPPKPDQRYTLAEVTDVLNEALMAKQFILIRRQMTFFLHDWTERLEPGDYLGLFPRVTLDELATRGRTELVQVVIQVEGPILDDDIASLKKLLGPFGTIMLLRNNTVIVQDTASNVTKIKQTIDLLSEPKPRK